MAGEHLCLHEADLARMASRLETVESTTVRIEENNKEYFKKLFGILEGDQGRDGLQTATRLLAVNVAAAVTDAEKAREAAEGAATSAKEAADAAEKARKRMPDPKWAGIGAGIAILIAWAGSLILGKIGWL